MERKEFIASLDNFLISSPQPKSPKSKIGATALPLDLKKSFGADNPKPLQSTMAVGNKGGEGAPDGAAALTQNSLRSFGSKTSDALQT